MADIIIIEVRLSCHAETGRTTWMSMHGVSIMFVLLQAALEQLSCTLEHHQHVIKATQNQLEGVGTSSSMVALSETGALSLFASEKGRERDEQFKRLVE